MILATTVRVNNYYASHTPFMESNWEMLEFDLNLNLPAVSLFSYSSRRKFIKQYAVVDEHQVSVLFLSIDNEASP